MPPPHTHTILGCGEYIYIVEWEFGTNDYFPVRALTFSCPITVGKGIVPEGKTLVHERRAKKGEGKKCQRQHKHDTRLPALPLYLSYN